MKKIYLLTIVVIFFLGSSCEIINPPEDLPAYINIEPFIFTIELDEGSSSHKIEDAWLYVGDDFLGAYTLPATVPVLRTGTQDILIDAGIKENGIGATPTVYPYYSRYRTTVNLTETETTTIEPETSYADNVEFVFIEDFNTTNLFGDDIDGNTATAIVGSADDAFEGQSGRIELTTDNPRIEVATSFDYSNLPTNGTSQVYLELDYKNDVSLGIGVIGLNNSGAPRVFYSHGLNPTTEWKKVYLNLTEVISNAQLQSYKISFAASLPGGMSNAVVLIDNVKLLHFE